MVVEVVVVDVVEVVEVVVVDVVVVDVVVVDVVDGGTVVDVEDVGHTQSTLRVSPGKLPALPGW